MLHASKSRGFAWAERVEKKMRDLNVNIAGTAINTILWPFAPLCRAAAMGRTMPFDLRLANVNFCISSPGSRHSEIVKSFGRRQAYESPRRTNPRGAEQ